MYNKKVMCVFKNPKHMGVIKNADGVGQVGNPMCLTPETIVHINDDSVKISDIDASKKVLSHDGRFNQVKRKMSRKYSGDIVIIKNKLGTTDLTPEHMIFAIRKPERWIYSYTKYKKLLAPAWYHAGDLRKGDLALYPILKEINDKKFIEMSQEKKKWDYRSIKIPNKIKVDADFLRLCGYYISEGHLRDKVTKTYLSFAFHIRENDLADDVERISNKIFGIKVKKRIIPERKTRVVEINNVFVARLIKSLFGKGAENKKIPKWMMLLPPEKQKHLLYGLWKGDGYFNAERPRAEYVTISYQLAQQIKILLLRQKIAPSIYTEKEKMDKKGVIHKKAYRLHIGERDFLERLAKILKINFVPKRAESIKSWFDKNYFYTPVTKIGKIRYSGDVHNLEIENSKSYITESLAVHNCGDVMKVYIKVEKKAGKEILKDVKVETFGCVAAITTSSVLADMAIGKTIDDALKISKKDVTEALGGLPLEKWHCSVLAVDALRSAVNDYRKK